MRIKSPTQLIFERKGRIFKFTPTELVMAEQRAKQQRVKSYQRRNLGIPQKTTTKKGKTLYQRDYMRIWREERRGKKRR